MNNSYRKRFRVDNFLRMLLKTPNESIAAILIYAIATIEKLNLLAQQ